MKTSVIGVLLLAMTACTWVDLTEEGKTVTLVTADVSHCKRLGTTTSATQADIASIDRSGKKVNTELVTLARNSAARMGGDTIVAESEISDSGEKTFAIYRCGE